MAALLDKSEIVPPPAPAPRAPLDLRPLGIIAVAGAMVWATSIAATTWQSVRAKPVARTIEITGSAKKRIASDLIQWQASVQTQAPDRTAAYKQLHDHIDKTVAFLTAQGIKADEIQPQSASFQELYETRATGVGEKRVETQISVGWQTTQDIVVRSTDVARVERASREVTSLLEQGVTVVSGSPAYYYTKLGELKIEMLAAAGKDARARAENILRSAGGAELGKLVDADMGVINVNPANSTSTSYEGNNDTSSFDKDIITIIHATFELE